MFQFVGLNLANHSEMSDHVLWLSQRGSFLQPFCLRRTSGCKDVSLKIPMLDKIFKIHAEGPALGSLIPLQL